MVKGSVTMSLVSRATSARTVSMDQSELIFPAPIELDLRPGDKAIYIGTLRMHRDEFHEVTKAELRDDYAVAMKPQALRRRTAAAQGAPQASVISRITRRGYSGEHRLRYVARDHASCADHGARADAHAGQDDGRAADPDVRADLHGLAVFQPRGGVRVEWMQRRKDHARVKRVKLPMRTGHTSSTTQLKLKNTRSPSSMLEP